MAANAKASHEHLKRGESSGQEADQQCVQCDQPGEPAARRAWLSRCVRRPNKDQIFFFSLSLSRIERRTPNADASQPSMSRGKIRRVRRQGIQGTNRNVTILTIYIYIYWVLTKKVAKKIRLYVAQET